MMDTYKNMAAIYEEIFPFSRDTFNLLKLMANENDKILDIGSATGSYVKAFIDEGFDALGVEYTEEFSQYNYPLLIGDMKSLPFKENSFDFIFSIGNTVCHLPSRRDFMEFLKKVHSLLKPKGRFLMQIINYDRIFAHSLKELPEINTEHYSFKRGYAYENPSSLDFIGEIKNKNGEIIHKFNQKLTPFMYQDIIWAVNSSGFAFVQFFGSFQMEKFIKNESFVNIACFTKS